MVAMTLNNYHCLMKWNLLVLTGVILTSSSVQSQEDGSQITIPALGRHALLGYLYDERTDEFRGVDVFKGPVTGAAINTTQKPGTSLKTSLIDTNKDKFRLYDIKASIQANFLSGMLQVTGSAEYLQEEKKSAKEVQGILLFECTTAVENLQLYYDDLKNQYKTDVVNQKGATHIVTQIKWGGNVAIAFSQKADEDIDKQKIGGSLELVFEKAKGAFSIKASASVDINIDDTDTKSDFSLNVKGDIVLPEQIPTTPEQVQALIKQVPELIRQTNGGKGVPIEFTLTPLGNLRKHLEQTAKENEFAKQIDESILNEFITIFEFISEIGQQLNDRIVDFRDNSVCVDPLMRTAMSKLHAKFGNEKIAFQGQMKELLIAVRTGTAKQKDLSDLVKNYEESEFSPAKVQGKLHEFEKTVRKIKQYKTIRKTFPNVEYFGYQSNLGTSLLSNIKHVIYVLYMFPDVPGNDKQSRNENEHLFFHTLNQPFNKLFVVDCEFEFEECKGLNQTVIQQVVNRKTNIKDVNEDLKRHKQTLPLEMTALGRFANLGQLYDARTDTFLSKGFLFANLPESLIQVTKNPGNVEVYDSPSEKYSDKFKSLNVDPELQYNILAEMSELTRSGQYFETETENKGPCPDQSLFHVRRLNEEAISVTDSKLLKYLVADAASKGATHFVSKIDYGFVSIFSAQNSHDQQNEFKEINTCTKHNMELKTFISTLRGILKRIEIPTNGTSSKGTISLTDVENLKGNFMVQIYSDIQRQGSQPHFVNSKEDLQFYVNNEFVPQQASINNGKGVPIAYVLYPLSNLGNEIGILLPYIEYGTISSNLRSGNAIVTMFEDIMLAKEQIQNELQSLRNNIDCVTDHDLKTLQSIDNDFHSKFGDYENRLKNMITGIKSGHQQIGNLKALLKDFKEQRLFDNEKRYIHLREIDAIKEKIQLCNQLRSENIVYLGRNSGQNSFDLIFTKRNEGTSPIYILFYHPMWTKTHGDLWRQNIAGLMKLGDLNNGKNIFVINCEFPHDSCKDIQQPAIHEYKNGKRTSTNVIESQAKEESNANSRIDTLEQIVKDKAKEEENLKLRVASLEGMAKNTSEVSIVSQNKIHELEDIVSNQTLQETNAKKKLAKLEETLSKKINAVKESFAPVRHSLDHILSVGPTQILKCGGKIALQPQGKKFGLAYKAVEKYRNNERCLWTFEFAVNRDIRRTQTFTLKMISNGFADDLDSLYALVWNRNSGLTSTEIENVFVDDSYTFTAETLFLSFTSDDSDTGTGFMVEVEVSNSETFSDRYGQSFHLNNSPGNIQFPRYDNNELFTIAIYAFKNVTFNVENINVEHHASCNHDFLKFFEIGQSGSITEKSKLCGVSTTSVFSYTTSYPILIIFSANGENTGGQTTISWS